MDPLWIGGIALAVLILVLVLAYLLLYKEQSFEDALASQNASNDIFLIQSKSHSGGKGGLRNRKKHERPKKERSRSEGESGNEKVYNANKLGPQIELEASDESDPTNLTKSLQDEATSLFDSIPDKPNVAESSEEEKPAQKPKRKTREKRKSERKTTQPPKEQEARPVREEIVVQESYVKTNAEETLEGLPPMLDEEPVIFPKEEAVIPAGNSSKKAKKSKAAKDKHFTAEPDLKSLMESLETANLNHSEIQKLVDILLDRQKSAEQWKTSGGKPDPMDLLRKQLNEKESAYKEEHSRAEGLVVKVKELRDELVQEKSKQKNIGTSATQRIKTLEKENEALQLRMTMTHKNNAQEHEKLLAALEVCEKTHVQTDWNQLKEELASANEIIQHSENQKAELEARILALETEISSSKENETVLAQQAADANDRVKSFDAVKNSLTQQLMETVKSKSESEHRLDMAKKDAESAHAEKSNAMQKAGAVQTQLDEERAKKSEFEKMFKALELKLKDTTDEHTKEKEMLVQQLQSASAKKDDVQVAELQKQSNDAVRQLEELKAKLAKAEEDHGATKQSLAGKEEELNKHEGEISNLKSLNSGKDEEIDVLRKAVSQHESEIVVMKNNMSQELQSAPPEVDDDKVKTLEEEIEKLTGQLNERKEQIAAWEISIANMKAKNNELREKNWKAMDAVSAAEKQQKSEIGKAVANIKEENKKNLQDLHADIKAFLCRIHPTVSIDKDLSYEKFLKEYENEMIELGSRSLKTESNDSKLEELEEELKKHMEKNEELGAQCAEYKNIIDSKDNELNEVLKKNEEFDTQCNKYKTLLGSTENMLHELEDNVEKEIADLKVTVENKDAEMEKTNSSLNELKEKLQKALDDAKSKDEQIVSLQEELASKASLDDKESELQKMTLTVAELKENLRKTGEDAKTKDLEFKKANDSVAELKENLRKTGEDAKMKDLEFKKVNDSVAELKESSRKATDELKSKDGKVKALQLELSTLKTAAATSSNTSKNELKKLSEEVERLKGQEKGLRDELDAAKNEAKLRAEEDKSPELEKYKSDASDAAKVNAALRKELEEVRVQFGSSKSSSPKKKHDKETDAKVKALEEKLALATKKESELQAKIAHLEDSASTTSLDEDTASPDSKDKKKKSKGFSLLGSKSSKYETKYRDMSEKYDHLKSESDEKTSRISELEAKLQNSEKALQSQEKKVKELSDNLQKAQVGGLSNGGVQNSGKSLNDSQLKQMAEAMKDGDSTGAV